MGYLDESICVGEGCRFVCGDDETGAYIVGELAKLLHPFDRKRYRNPNVIERMFGRLKDFRRVATRYDKNAENYMAGLCLAALICYWI